MDCCGSSQYFVHFPPQTTSSGSAMTNPEIAAYVWSSGIRRGSLIRVPTTRLHSLKKLK